MTTKLKAGEMAARARLTLVVAALVVSLPASPAHADDAAATTRAQADVNAAAAHYDAGRFHEAYVLFKSASADYPSPHVRANMVLAGSKSGHPTDRVESARVARALLRDGKMKPQDVVHVTSALEALGPTLGRIEVRGQGTTPVRVDGVLVEHTQLVDPYDVVPGSHEVLFAAERPS